jgi:RNA polymerase sigma factor (TIGR02999 family)
MSAAKEPEGDETVEITALLRAVDDGGEAARARLFERVYGELKRIARRQLRSAGHEDLLDTTALVHEAYLKLSRGARWSTRDRFHFFALTAQAMRQVLVDHARKRMSEKRGGGAVVARIDDLELSGREPAAELIALDEALRALEQQEPDLARLVEQRFFAGLEIEEIAALHGVSDRTVKRRWRLARAFLLHEMTGPGLT